MRDSMQRGGPDDCGSYVDLENHVFLGHRRLALIDLSVGGHQPKSISEGKIQIVYNGEVYNYKELKSQLISLGYSFYTESDTEVILTAYQEWNTDCFSRFNGMFALAIYDKIKNKLILARDHAGIKPLYYSIRQGKLYFASEIKAFKTLKPDWPEREDWKIYFLAFGHLPEPVTTLRDVRPLPKASYLEYHIKTQETGLHTHYHYKHAIQNISPREAFEWTRAALDQSIKRHLISDAPIGLFLSGGIDSSLLTLLAKPYLGDQLKTLSIYFEDEKFSEKKYQDIIIKKTGAHHQSYCVSQSEFDKLLPDALQAMDQPSTDAINTYFISKYAHDFGLTAVLSGIGADELFGGYPSIKKAAIKRAMSYLPSSIVSIAGSLSFDKYHKLQYVHDDTSTGEYLFYRGFFDYRSIAAILDAAEDDVRSTIQSLNTIAWNGQSAMERASDIEYHYYMQNQLLKDADYMSMWHGLEIRVPFLDKELIALTFSLPPALRFSDVKPKYVLTEAYKEVLPVEIWNRTKQGFTFPFSTWLKKNQVALPQNPIERKYFDLFNHDKLTWSRYWAVKLCGMNNHSG